jgi:hypothetical protein
MAFPFFCGCKCKTFKWFRQRKNKLYLMLSLPRLKTIPFYTFFTMNIPLKRTAKLTLSPTPARGFLIFLKLFFGSSPKGLEIKA